MDARQQMTFAPFFRLRLRAEVAGHDIALALQRGQGEHDLGFGQAQCAGQGRHLRRADGRHSPAQQLAHGPVALPVGNAAICRRL